MPATHGERESLIGRHHRYAFIVTALSKSECVWVDVMKDEERKFYL